MALKLSTGLRDGLAVTGPLRTLLGGAVIRFYAGTAPATADADVGGATLLLEVSKEGTGDGIGWEETPVDGALVKAAAEQWRGVVVAEGTASFFRIVLPSDTGAASTTAIRAQGTVGQVVADAVIPNPAMLVGQIIPMNAGAITIPASAL